MMIMSSWWLCHHDDHVITMEWLIKVNRRLLELNTALEQQMVEKQIEIHMLRSYAARSVQTVKRVIEKPRNNGRRSSVNDADNEMLRLMMKQQAANIINRKNAHIRELHELLHGKDYTIRELRERNHTLQGDIRVLRDEVTTKDAFRMRQMSSNSDLGLPVVHKLKRASDRLAHS